MVYWCGNLPRTPLMDSREPPAGAGAKKHGRRSGLGEFACQSIGKLLAEQGNAQIKSQTYKPPQRHHMYVAGIVRSGRNTVGAGKTIDRYGVAGGHVFVSITAGGQYLVEEPPVQKAVDDTYRIIIDKMRKTVQSGMDCRPTAETENLTDTKLRKLGLAACGRRKLNGIFNTLRYYVMRDLTGYGILHPLMEDPDIESVEVSATDGSVSVEHRRHSGRFGPLKTNISFPMDADMRAFASRMFPGAGNWPVAVRRAGAE